MATLIEIIWTEYMKHRASVRGFDLARIEGILRNSSERYVDTVTGRLVVVGRHDTLLVMIPYEVDEGIFTPITIHATTRQQISARLKSGRFTYE